MKAVYISSLVISSAWVITTLVLLIIYSKQELNDVYVDVQKDQNGNYTGSVYEGIIIIVHHTFNMATLLVIIRLMIYFINYGNAASPFRYVMIIIGAITATSSLTTGLIAFASSCQWDSSPCFNDKHGPLYIFLLVNVSIPCIAIGLFIIIFMGWVVLNACYPEEDRPVKPVEQNEPPVQITLETLQQIHQQGVNTKCSLCQKEFEKDKADVKLLKCSHHFHISCLEDWQKKSKKCPECKAIIV